MIKITEHVLKYLFFTERGNCEKDERGGGLLSLKSTGYMVHSCTKIK